MTQVELWPHAVAVALIFARLLPAAFLCPVLGGQTAPSFVRLGVVMSFAVTAHGLGGVEAPPETLTSHWAMGTAALRECVLGVVMGLAAGLPMDAARIGGRFMDMVRGASAEAILPGVGVRESATGHGLHQLVLAVVAAGPLFAMFVRALLRTFAQVRLGVFAASEATVLRIASLATCALGTGLSIGIPVAFVAFTADLFVGLASRAAPQLNVAEMGAPLKILGGAVALYLSFGLISEKLLTTLDDALVRLPSVLAS